MQESPTVLEGKRLRGETPTDTTPNPAERARPRTDHSIVDDTAVRYGPLP